MRQLILLILIFTISSSVVIAASAGGDSKNTASKGVKAATKFDIGEKWISKAKKFEKKNKVDKAKKAYEKAIKSLLEANVQNPSDPDTLNLLGFSTIILFDSE